MIYQHEIFIYIQTDEYHTAYIHNTMKAADNAVR